MNWITHHKFLDNSLVVISVLHLVIILLNETKLKDQFLIERGVFFLQMPRATLPFTIFDTNILVRYFLLFLWIVLSFLYTYQQRVKDKYWYVRLSPNHRVLHYGDCDEKMIPSVDELPNKLPVTEINYLTVGKDCPHMKDARFVY